MDIKETPVAQHKSIYEALSRAQGEFPEIPKTKHFGKPEDKMHFMYSSLDDVLNAVRPVTSRHGLCFNWEASEDKQYIRCVLRHETTHTTYHTLKTVRMFDGVTEETNEIKAIEEGVMFSPYVKVSRSGDMKGVGSDSTYARRYTLCEVLGVASEEDKDIGRQEVLENNIISKFRLGIQNAKTVAEVEKAISPIKTDYDKYVKMGKKSNLGFKKDVEENLIDLAMKRITELGGTGAPGDNADMGGDAVVDINDTQHG